jgi:hypothetical protein
LTTRRTPSRPSPRQPLARLLVPVIPVVAVAVELRHRRLRGGVRVPRHRPEWPYGGGALGRLDPAQINDAEGEPIYQRLRALGKELSFPRVERVRDLRRQGWVGAIDSDGHAQAFVARLDMRRRYLCGT